MPTLADLSLAFKCICSQMAVWLWAGSCRITSHGSWLTSCLLGQCESQSQFSLIIQKASLGLFSQWLGNISREWAEVHKAFWEICLFYCMLRICQKIHIYISSLDLRSGKSVQIPFLDRKTWKVPYQIWEITRKGIISTIFSSNLQFYSLK